MFSNASNFVKGVDTAFVVILSITFFFLIALTVALVYFLYRYKNTRNPVATHIEGNHTLELAWTIIPLILVLGMFWFGWTAWKPMEANPPNESLWIKTTARAWKWGFEYPNGKITDTLYVPQGEPIALRMKALDYIHSLYIPAFRIKKDIVPGNDRDAWFIANSPGTYDLFCTEYCGLQHSSMISIVEVLPKDQFEKWYGDTASVLASSAAAASLTPVQMGAKAVQRLGCNACHSIDGKKIIGPSYLGIFGHDVTVITDGKERTVLVDEEYIKRSILEPNADVVKGFNKGLMLDYKGQISDEELSAIVEYIKSIK